MSLDIEQVKHIARLARIELAHGEAEDAQEQQRQVGALSKHEVLSLGPGLEGGNRRRQADRVVMG